MNVRNLVAAAIFITSVPAAGIAQDIADQIWSGGPILTMNEAGDRTDAVAV